ncbi:hypothetical protein [Sphingobium sp. B2]|uniref:hypothetical protein n=1 Tax=Sphingobium sp. B2 TaxID=2583228 RepID=UPI0011A2707C|nr:hypothetical protein [Sphingobium sp. B2]
MNGAATDESKDDVLTEARQALQQQAHDRAIHLCEGLLRDDPANGDALYIAAVAARLSLIHI